MKKTTALILALAAVISLSACNSSPKTETSSNPETSTSAPDESSAPATDNSPETIDGSPESSSPVTESSPSTTEGSVAAAETSEPAEPEPAAPVADTAYWDLMCEEYKQYYPTTASKTAFVEGKFIGRIPNPNSNFYTIFFYDTSTRQLKYLDGLYSDNFRIANGKLYVVYSEGFRSLESHIKCFDPNGNELFTSETINSGLSIAQIFEDGSIRSGFQIFSPDLSEVKDITPEISYDIGHGKTETYTEFSHKGYYGNTMYFICSSDTTEEKCFAYDITTYEIKEIDPSSNLYYYLLNERGYINSKFGKYCFSERGILDIETDEIINSTNFTDTGIFFGEHWMMKAIINDDFKLEVYKFVLPENWEDFAEYIDEYITEYGTLIYTSECDVYPYTNQGMTFYTEDYARLQDSVGCFLIDLNDGSEVEFVLPE